MEPLLYKIIKKYSLFVLLLFLVIQVLDSVQNIANSISPEAKEMIAIIILSYHLQLSGVRE